MKSNRLSRFLTITLVIAILILTSCTSSGTVNTQTNGSTTTSTTTSITQPTTATSTAAGLPANIKIGAFLALTGSAAGYATEQQNGIQLAVDEINNTHFLGNGTDISIIIQDTGDTNDGTEAAVNQLLAEGVSCVIGPTITDQGMFAYQAAEKALVPILIISNTMESAIFLNDYIFRVSQAEKAVADQTLKTAMAKYNIKTVHYVYDNTNDFTSGSDYAFLTAVNNNNSNGISSYYQLSFKTGTTDFSDEVGECLYKNPDGVLLSALPEDAALFMKQARAAGYTGRFIGGSTLNTPEIIQLAGEAAEGMLVGTDWVSYSNAPKNTAFIAAYKAKYGVEPGEYAAQAYTAVWLAARAMKNANSAEPQAVHDALAALQNIDTPLGSISFDKNHERTIPPTVQIVQNGVFVVVN
jgi:branched-chain amino acid transport system substrate-binding protein